jgi:meso-butanediol dehydrogenase/(S,S)-butanediol dehydrogenase/diacetyl reductase
VHPTPVLGHNAEAEHEVEVAQMGLLEGQTAIVTGGGSGIGRATCRRMREEGARVAVLDVNHESAQLVAKEVDGTAHQVDVSDAEALRAAVDEAVDALGGLTIMYNNAGIGNMSSLHQWDPAEWNRIIGVNLTGVYHGFRAAVPHILAAGGGSIVSTASISGVRPSAGEAPYSAAKAGVAAITASAALEYGPRIRVNAVAPGLIQTALTDPLLQFFPNERARYERTTPVGRLGEPEDIADVVVFLCSDLARFITGQNLVVDGGMTLHGAGVDGIFEQMFPAGS